MSTNSLRYRVGSSVPPFLSWWFAFPPGSAFVRSNGGLGGSCGVGSLSFWRSDGWWPSSAARTFSSVTVYADAIDMLLLVPIKNYVSSGRGSASSCRRLLRSPATSMTGQFLQGSGCNFCFFQRYLCKIWDVNYQENI